MRRSAFTLVELLVVIGIIGLLIAILMPALSAARKQALAISCGSNERQITVGMLSYANDWREMLPTKESANSFAELLMSVARLPIIGFDTTTVWDYTVQRSPVTDAFGSSANPAGMGGLGFVMRDYLKNNWAVGFCPDGWMVHQPSLVRDFFQPAVWGYSFLPHRPNSGGIACALTGETAIDRPGDVARTASGDPTLAVLADANFRMTACVSWLPGPYGMAGGRFFANHVPTSNRSPGPMVPLAAGGTLDFSAWPLYDAHDHDTLPAGLNVARIDGRTRWVAWQNVPINRYLGSTLGWFATAW